MWLLDLRTELVPKTVQIFVFIFLNWVNLQVYVGIPYASPPIKSHRFGPTQTALPWDGVKDAVKPGFVCPQVRSPT